KFFLGSAIFGNKKFVALLLLAPAIFAWKMAAQVNYRFSADFFENEYWNAVIYWPYKVVVICIMLYLVHHFFDRGMPFYGATLRDFSAKPYFIMLLIMVPLVAAASTQKDFLSMYPRMQSIEYLLQPGKGWHQLLYELSYGLDFFSIELFFRGFLVLAFAKWAGKNAILPMAIFYCTIHFGKPMGECISSYFGGMILGVVAYHTRSIFGGFMVHVGIAWLMELGGTFPLSL
ncbi:MAG TPA: CPBP family intramembrane glutamic endopeptidase, partial [Flavisolibacter sp.]|nr:CPBP family intramembrane glutamic endopeptidase [Flavisolibacter sp.]